MFQFWHGGQRWIGAPEVQAPRQGRYECGPGIYLTNRYLTARKYAAGGKVTTLVTLSENVRWLQHAKLPVKELLGFLDTVPRLKGRERVKADFEQRCMRREMAVEDLCPVEYLVNVLINTESLAGKVGLYLADWLVSKGVDASLHNAHGQEQWVVVFNPTVLAKYTVVSASAVPLDSYELPRIQLPVAAVHKAAVPSAQPPRYREAAVPGHPDLVLRVYGVDRARDRSESMAQGFCVLRDGLAVARAELTPAERAAVQAFLVANYPEHSKL